MVQHLLDERVQAILAVVAKTQAKALGIELISSITVAVQVEVFVQQQPSAPIAIGRALDQYMRWVHRMDSP